MIDNPIRFKDDIGTVIWLFPGSELDMRGDRFSIFREFRSVCKIWLNSYGTIYRDMKNRLRLSSKDYSPRDDQEMPRMIRKTRQTEKSRARFAALPTVKSRGYDFDFLENCGVYISVGHRRSSCWSCLTSVSASETTLIPKKVQISRIVEAVRVPTVTLIEMKQEHVRSNPVGGSYEDGTVTARSFQLGHLPNWTGPARRAGRVFYPAQPSAKLDWSGSADGRAGCVFDPARPSAELDWFILAGGRASRIVDPAPPSAELDWFSSAVGRAGGWSSWRLVDPARPSAELDGVLCPPFIKTGITYATG
ncbi:hypothetical protein F2Q69_00043305 [Brassica cretica]|uniref:Uncharacterized protein n=1 Tax=Brassica cretica TaxID=69181 RepID=A0A8S9NGG1_BRACR|nr:hypothetical protein F2Q69_00043305 [Brassica cretica]